MRFLFTITLIFSLTSCERHDEFIYRRFEINDKALLTAIDSLYIKYPQYKVPEKWTIYDSYSYSQKRYGFSNERRFYFGPPTEEMYSVAIYDDDTESRIAISAMHDFANWHLESNLSPDEIERIDNRFDSAIISKLETLSGSKSRRVD